jgi:histidinol dehydrogenase
VTEAKRQVYGQVGIDSLAGPSEVAVIADEKTPLDYILYDLQAQAEHDPNSISTLYTTSASVIAKIQKKLDKSTKSRVRLIRVDTIEQGIEKANDLAPEHFELLIENAEAYLPLIKHAGAVFLGPASPAAIGDYVAGPSHVLPTQRSAQFSSGLSVMTFLKRSSVISFQGTENESSQWNAAITMAQTEGMPYHEKSLHVRRHW